jgi:hypothetical protein
MPGKGKYTVYNTNNSTKKAHLARLFSGIEGSTTPPFVGKNTEEALAEATKMGNDILRALGTDGIIASGDPAWGTEGGKVDLTYQGRYATSTPPVGDFTPERPGDPMNVFMPDISSPGAGKSGENASEIGEVRVSGLDKTVERNPKLSPNEYLGSRGKTFVPSSSTRQPGQVGTKIHDANILGEDNKFNTKDPSQYPE